MFTKITRPVVEYVQLAGHRLSSYLEDFLGGAQPDQYNAAVDFAIATLLALGWALAMHKLDRTRTCEATFTGLVYRTAGASGSIHASAVREAELKADLADALAQSKVSARRLAQITGRISSMSPALGRAAHFYTRHLQRAVAAADTRSRAAMERRMLPVRNKVRA